MLGGSAQSDKDLITRVFSYKGTLILLSEDITLSCPEESGKRGALPCSDTHSALNVAPTISSPTSTQARATYLSFFFRRFLARTMMRSRTSLMSLDRALMSLTLTVDGRFFTNSVHLSRSSEKPPQACAHAISITVKSFVSCAYAQPVVRNATQLQWLR